MLVVGHSAGFNPTIKMIREIVASGEAGPLRMMTNLVYTNFLYRPRRPEELDTTQGGGIIFNQIPHQLDVIRVIHGGQLESAYAVTGVWGPFAPNRRRDDGALAVHRRRRPHR